MLPPHPVTSAWVRGDIQVLQAQGATGQVEKPGGGLVQCPDPGTAQQTLLSGSALVTLLCL